MTHDDRISRDFRALRRLMLREGRFALSADLRGAGGVLFRTFWHAREGEGAPGRWSTRSADVCPGDPLGRAAEAFGFRLARPDGGGIEGARLERRGTEDSIGDRVRAFSRSLDEGLALTRLAEWTAEGIFAGGFAAYERLVSDLGAAPESFLPSSPDEARRLAPRVETAGAPRGSWPPLSMGLALAGALAAFGRARLDLASYLDHISNFLDSSGAVAPFRREGETLLRAAARLPGDDPLRLADAVRSDRLFRAVRADVRKAAAFHRRGVRALERVSRA